MTKKKTETKPDPVLTEAATVEIAGETYTVQRLSFRHAFKVGRILGNAVGVVGDTRYSALEVAQVFVASLVRAEDDVMALLADLLDVDRKDLDDPERFPMASLVDVAEAISQNQDLRDFLDKLGKLMEKMPEMQTA